MHSEPLENNRGKKIIGLNNCKRMFQVYFDLLSVENSVNNNWLMAWKWIVLLILIRFTSCMKYENVSVY